MTGFRQWGLLLVAAALAAALGYGVGHWVLRTPSAPAPEAQRDFTLRDLDGRSHSLKEWQGKVVLLNFWATWCPPCREEMPLLIAAQQRYAAQGLQIVGVAVDTPDAVAAYRDRMHIDYPLLMGGDDAIPLMARFGNTGGALPYSVFLDPTGAVVARKIGAFQARELDQRLVEMLATKPQVSHP
jgi:thiol-disulfide isomerase/thioredoxin